MIMRFYVRQVTCNCKKKLFVLQFCEIFLFWNAWKTTSCERKFFLWYMGVFTKLTCFHCVYFQFTILICAIWRVMEMQLVFIPVVFNRRSGLIFVQANQVLPYQNHVYMDLQCPPLILAPLINMSKGGCENKSALFILLIFHSKNSQNSNLSLK